ncbi:TetR/AcrR family transcriptional regulator [Nocardia aurea]|uniref:TetR/AcrR family transcriptional regulator n=1 Tax=Nocardia aurea TaxID=2144174 RepID=UPI003F4CABCA
MTASAELRNDRAGATRDALLRAAERLLAESGMYAVSNRQISDAAGQRNNAAVCYHFGTRADLLRAIECKHREPIEALRRRMLTRIADSADLRDWVDAFVRPFTEHLDDLGVPSWYARFAAQAIADPAYRDVVSADALVSPPLVLTLAGIARCLPDLPEAVRARRMMMTRNLLIHSCAELEGELAQWGPRSEWTWTDAADELTDAIVGLWQTSDTVPGRRAPRTRSHPWPNSE